MVISGWKKLPAMKFLRVKVSSFLGFISLGMINAKGCKVQESVVKSRVRWMNMKDFPVFATDFGVASLVLKEIPYRTEAYIIIQNTQQPLELLQECISFCRMCGAEKIYARGHQILDTYPLYCAVYEMHGYARVDEAQVANLWPVTEETVVQWRQLMNERLRSVDNAATLEKKDEQEILQSGGAYFVHNRGELLGAGWLQDGELKLLASCKAGAGEQVCHTLFSTIPDLQIKLEVASSNGRAIRLYEKLGFISTAELRRWYRVG